MHDPASPYVTVFHTGVVGTLPLQKHCESLLIMFYGLLSLLITCAYVKDILINRNRHHYT